MTYERMLEIVIKLQQWLRDDTPYILVLDARDLRRELEFRKDPEG